MADLKYMLIVILVITNCTRCELSHNIIKRVSEINNRSLGLYGRVRRGSVKKDLPLEKLMYPRGNKVKLSALSQAWRDYYTCSASQLSDVKYISQINIIIMVFLGASARLPCNICIEPGQENQHTWLYAKRADIENFKPVQGYDRLLFHNGVLKIFNVMLGDEGVFRCNLRGGSSGLVFIEVVDKEPYYVVKPPDSRGPHAVATEIYEGVILFTQWGDWSECSVCGKVGRRRRYGICYVKLEQALITSFVLDPVTTASRFKLFELDDKIIELFQTFPGGLPCRSQYLPQIMKHLDVIQQRPSEILISLCKVPCDTRTKRHGKNNTDENGTLIYPITSKLPKQPPLPFQDTIFVDFGQRVVLRCPGTTLRDVPIQWRAGTKYIVPRDVDKVSGGRVFLNCRDHLVFTSVLYTDENLYSCWQRDHLAGVVKLIVWQGAHARWNHHVTLVVVVLLLAIVLHLVEQGARSLQRRQNVLYHLY